MQFPVDNTPAIHYDRRYRLERLRNEISNVQRELAMPRPCADDTRVLKDVLATLERSLTEALDEHNRPSC
jgi:hypothetical protein